MMTNFSRHLRSIGSQFELVGIFHFTPQELKKHIFSRPKASEIIALVFSVCILLGLVFIQRVGNYITYYDLLNFLSAGRGDFNHFFYA